MSSNNNDNKKANDSSAQEQGWDDIALTPRKATFDPHVNEAVIIGQGAGSTNFDLEARAPLPDKKRSWLSGKKVKVVIGIAVVVIVVVGVTVPMVVGIRKAGSKGIIS